MQTKEDQEQFYQEAADAARDAFEAVFDDPAARVDLVYHLWRNWADFHIYVIDPVIPAKPVEIIQAEMLDNGELEHVYSIHDEGYHLGTSKAEDMFSSGMSMCRLYYTIEKMINVLVERLNADGIDSETEVRVAFSGHELGQRKAFEVIINLDKMNLVVTNFDPGSWGEKYLKMVKDLAEKGYGLPPEAPRLVYREHGTPSNKTTKSRL